MTARLIENDIFSGVLASAAGASAIIDLNGSPNISCQLIFFATSPVDATITFQSSNVGGLDDADWTDLGSPVPITADGSYLYTEADVTYRFFRAVKARTSGTIDVQGRVLVTGDGEGGLPESFFEPLDSGPITNLTNDVSADGPGSVPATVNSVGGSTAAAIHAAVLLAAAATAANTASAIVKRDGSGNFAAGVITATLNGSASAVGGITVTGTPSIGDVLTATSATDANWQAGGGGGGITELTGDVSAGPGSGSQAATVNSVGGSSAANIHTSQLLTAAATATNTADTLVKRDGSGNFAAAQITATTFVGALTGTASGNPPNARTISTTAPLTGGGDLSANRTIAMPVATASVDGYLAAADFATFAAKASSTLTDAHIYVGNGSNVATDVAVSGDLTLANTGAFTIANSAITNAKVSASAAIDYSKLATLTSGNILVGSVGNVATSVAMSGDATIIASGALTIAANAVTNAKLATMATASFKGRTTAGTGNVEDLTATQATAILNAMVGDSGSGGTKGLVPAPSAGDAAAGKFLKADGTFAVPSGGASLPTGTDINYIPIASQSSSTGWTASGAGVTVATDTSSAFRPRSATNSSALQVTRVSGSTDYAYIRYTLDNVDQNTSPNVYHVLQCAYMGGASNASNDWRIQVWHNTASNYSGTYTQATVVDGPYGAFSATFNNRNWMGWYNVGANVSNGIYVEVRVKLNASTSGTEIHIQDFFAGYCYGASLAPGQLYGTSTNDTPISGGVGELLINNKASASAVSLTTATIAQIATITLTPGQWEVTGGIGFKPDTTTSITAIEGGIDTTTASFGGSDGIAYAGPTTNCIKASTYMTAVVPGATTAFLSLTLPTIIIRTSTSLQLYLNARGTFTVSTLGGFGFIKAIRSR